MRLPGDVVFSAGALLMGWDFLMKLRRPLGLSSEQPQPTQAAPAE
jgi:hypothetical protein